MGLLSPPHSSFEPPTTLRLWLYFPLTSIVTLLHFLLLFLRGPPYRPPPSKRPIRVVCISDTHAKIPPQQLPRGEVLIHCGDLTDSGNLSSIQRQIDWLKTYQKRWPGSSDGFRHIIVIAGNHDSYFDERSRSAHDRAFSKRKLDWGDIRYLQHEPIILPFLEDRRLTVYGAPQIPKCGGKEFAFQYQRGQDAWSNTISDDVDILVTHNPPKYHLDLPENGGLGCEHELREVWRVKPTLHVFGHVHAGYGKESVWWDKGQTAFERFRELAFREFGAKQMNVPLLSEFLNMSLARQAVEVVYQDIRGLLWTRLWGGARHGGWMVNAALSYRNTGKLKNKPWVVDL